MNPRFGPAGNSDSFTEKGYRHLEQVPEYLQEFGLDAFEYQCGHGVRISQKKADGFGRLASKQGIQLSLHSPYYISLSSVEKEKRDKSIQYILDTMAAAKAMGAKRVVVHSGSCGKQSREAALELAKDTIQRALKQMDELGFGDIALCPETMGKINQLGNLDEVLQLCRLDDRLIPCIDFGHLNARTFGGIQTKQDYITILSEIKNQLGEERLRTFHSHFSKIEYTPKGGEKCHLTFADAKGFGPEFEPLAELIVEWNLSPTMICESAGTQAEDAFSMKQMVEQVKG